MSERPETIDDAASIIRDHADAGRVVQPRGGGTKLGWGVSSRHNAAFIDIDTRSLNRVIVHNAGDFTAVLEAGLPLAEAQAIFARAGQMLAIDPPLGDASAATIGGVLATSDSGPLRHRYGSMRDLVIGITVVLSDGTIAKSGGQVIKNVAGYDLAKLFAGSFGTLGLIARVAVRLHPRPSATATVEAASSDPEQLATAIAALAKLPLEADCFDVAWSEGKGRLLIRFAGAASEQRALVAAKRIVGLDAVETVTDDGDLWARQRSLQRLAAGNATGIVVKIAGRPTDLPAVLRAADAAGGSVVLRAALGLAWVTLPGEDALSALRQSLAPGACTVLDGSARVADPWPLVEPGVLALMRRVKARFDPDRAFRPGTFVGGI